jgi:hypothetical protein
MIFSFRIEWRNLIGAGADLPGMPFPPFVKGGRGDLVQVYGSSAFFIIGPQPYTRDVALFLTP